MSVGNVITNCNILRTYVFAKYGELLKSTGVNTKGATMEIYKYTADDNGFIIKEQLISRTKCN